MKLFVRAKDRTVAYQLHHLGVVKVYRETFETSATMGEDVLKHLGMRAYQAKRAKLRYQQEDEALVKQLAATYMQEDENEFVLRVQEQLGNLAQVLASEQRKKEHGMAADDGWDDTSLVKDLGKKKRY